MSRRKRRLIYLATPVLLIALLLLLAPAMARQIIRWRLQAMISQQLNAKLDIGHLAYHAPYSVTVRDASLTTFASDKTPLELLHIPQIDLELARLPFGRGPLVIQSLIVQSPSLHLIKTANGLIGRPELTTPTSPPPAIDQPSSVPSRQKLSDLFRLTRFTLSDGKIVVEDKTSPDAAPLVWKHLNFDLRTDRKSAAQYGFHVVAGNSKLMALDARGTADIDDLALALDECLLKVDIDPDSLESPLSAELQKPLRQWHTRGTLAMNLAGRVPLRDIASSTYRMNLEFDEAGARVPEWNTTLDHVKLKMRLTDGSEQLPGPAIAASPARRPTLKIDVLEASSGDAGLHVENLLASADLGHEAASKWRLEGVIGRVVFGASHAAFPPAIRAELDRLKVKGAIEFSIDASGPTQSTAAANYSGQIRLTPIGLTFEPPALGAPITDIDPIILRTRDGGIFVTGVRASSAGNLLFLKSAWVDLDGFPKTIRCRDVAGCLTLGPGRQYPAALANLLNQAKPVGPFFFDGVASLQAARPKETLDYDFQVHTERGRLTVTEHQIPITNIDTLLHVTPATTTVTRFEASVLNGSVNATGNIAMTGVNPYTVNAAFRDVDLKELSRLISAPNQSSLPLSGRAVVRTSLHGVIPADRTPLEKAIAGEGELEVLGGRFWQIPVMKSIADSVNVQQATTVGEAAAQFHLKNGNIHFDQVIANAPALGVEGTGDVDFEGNLNLKLIADVLGKWGERVGDVGDGGGIADLLNTVQHGVNVATKQALYEVDVTGNASAPRTVAVPAPFLSRQVKRLLGTAVDGSKKIGLLDALHKESPGPTRPALTTAPPEQANP